MGNRTSTGSVTMQEVKYNPDLTGFQIVGEGDTYNIWRNRATAQEMEQYTQATSNQNQFKYLRDVFQFRYDRDYIVSSIYFKQNPRQQICSTFHQASLFLQRIPLRLNQIRDLPYPDSLHLVNSCLKGFRQLYNRVGSFNINQHLIGINSEARVKVWISQDFGRQRLPNFQQPPRRQESIMVVEMMEIIDKTIDHRTQPQSITAYILRGGVPTFEEALDRLQQYSIKYVVQIPHCLNSIAQLRDRGYFKKMPPSRKTFIGRSGHSFDTSERQSIQFQSTPDLGLTIANNASIHPPLSALPIVYNNTPIIQNASIPIQSSIPVSGGYPSHIRGIPVVQNPNIKVNTYYSNTPVGGTFRLHNKNITTVPAQLSSNNVQRVIQQTPRNFYSPQIQTQTHTQLASPKSAIPISPRKLLHPTSSVPIVKSIKTQYDSLNAVQKILQQIKDLKHQSKDQIVGSGYIYQFQKNSSSFQPQATFGTPYTNSSLNSYHPLADGGTNPQLLKLAKFDNKKSFDQKVTTSYDFVEPILQYKPISQENSETKIKSILKNKVDNSFPSYGPSSNLGNQYRSQYRSQVIADSRPADSELARTIYNREEYSQTTPKEMVLKKQVQTYRANIKIHTPSELHRNNSYY